MKAWIKRNYYRFIYRKKNVRFGPKVLLNTKNHFEGNNTIGKHTEIATCHIGLGTYVSDNSIIKYARVGRFCSIGSNVHTGLGRHPSNTFVSTHPSFFSTKQQAGFSFAKHDIFDEHVFLDAEKRYVVEIGNDVWIGSNVMIMDGISIGDGAIIAAGAIVTRNVLPYAIVTGIPAKQLKFRFSEDQIKKLLALKWWDWDFAEIRSKSHLFSNIDKLLAMSSN